MISTLTRDFLCTALCSGMRLDGRTSLDVREMGMNVTDSGVVVQLGNTRWEFT